MPNHYTYQGQGSGGQSELDALSAWYHDPNQSFNKPGERTVWKWWGPQTVQDWSERDKAQEFFKRVSQQLSGGIERKNEFQPLYDQVDAATNPGGTNKLHDLILNQIRQAQGGAQGGAAARAGAFGAQGNVLNRGRYVNAAASQAGKPYAAATGQAGIARAQALQKLQMDRFQLLYTLNRAEKGDKDALEKFQLAWKELELREKAINAQIEAGEADGWDFLGPVLQAGGQLGAAAITASDRRLKWDITHAGKSPSGINIYEFSYLNSPKRYRGVMAQEVPQASQMIGEYLYVDYSKIDVPFEVV